MARSIMAASLSRPSDSKEIHSFKASNRRVVSREVVTRFGMEVVGVQFDGVEVACVAQQKAAAGDGLPEQFVEVDAEGVCLFDSAQLFAMPSGEEERAAIGRVDVEPRTG